MATTFTGKLGANNKTQNRNAQENHGHGHWMENLINHWHRFLVNTRNLVEEAICATQLVSHMLPWDVAIYAVGLDEKDEIPVGQKVDLSATQLQPGRTISRNRDKTVSGDNNFKCDKVVAYIIHRLKVAKDVKASQYSGGAE